MCNECNWTDFAGSYKIKEICDCGNKKWIKAYEEKGSDFSVSLFRCSKCDHLQYAKPRHLS